MGYLPIPTGTIFRPEEYAIFNDLCPLCSTRMGEFYDSTLGKDERAIHRVCMHNPARKNLMDSHLVKSHYYETVREYIFKMAIVSFNQHIYVRQTETHPSKYLISIQYQGPNKKSYINVKDSSKTIQLPGWWNPGDLNIPYREIYDKAERLINFT